MACTSLQGQLIYRGENKVASFSASVPTDCDLVDPQSIDYTANGGSRVEFLAKLHPDDETYLIELNEDNGGIVITELQPHSIKGQILLSGEFTKDVTDLDRYTPKRDIFYELLFYYQNSLYPIVLEKGKFKLYTDIVKAYGN